MQSDKAGFDTLHAYFLDRLLKGAKPAAPSSSSRAVTTTASVRAPREITNRPAMGNRSTETLSLRAMVEPEGGAPTGRVDLTVRGVGSLCIGAGNDPRYNARRMVGLLIAGLRRP